MSRQLSCAQRRSTHPLGLLLAALAFVSQLALGSMVLPDSVAVPQSTELDALSIVCRAGSAPQHRPQPDPRGHRADWALCPLAAALALPSVVLLDGPLLPLRLAPSLVAFWTPIGARGPPARASRLRLPRGPPVLS